MDREELKKEDGDMSDSYGQLSPPRGGPHPDTDDTNTNDEIDAAEVTKASSVNYIPYNTGSSFSLDQGVFLPGFWEATT